MRKYSGILSAVAAIFLIAVASSTALAQQTITVNTTLDGGFICFPGPCPPQCALRDAITAANENRVVNGCAAGQSSGADRIVFNVGSGTPTISLRSGLPPIIEPVEINGGTGGATRIEINGSRIITPVGNRVDGLILATGESTIRNLVINGFSGNGVVMTSISGGGDPPIPPDGGVGSRNKIFGCFIGADKTGTIAIGNGSGINAAGVVDTAGILTDTDMHIIGGPAPEERNVISGNRGHGLILGGRGHLVRGNFIGVNVNGGSLGNQFDGINIAGGRFSNATGTIGASQFPWDGKCQVVIDSTGRVIINPMEQVGIEGDLGVLSLPGNLTIEDRGSRIEGRKRASGSLCPRSSIR